MATQTEIYEFKKTVILVILLFLSTVIFLDSAVTIERYFPIKVHEFGHKAALEGKPGIKYCFYELTPTAHQTVCIPDGTEIKDSDMKLFYVAGYGLEFLVAVILMLTPFSLLGGAWMLRIMHSVLFYNNFPSTDLHFLSGSAKGFIALFLAFMFSVSLYIQNKCVDYALKRLKKYSKK